MSLRDAYRQKMEARLAEEQARLELLKARAKVVLADSKIMGYEQLADAEQKLETAKHKLKALAHASEDAFAEMKTGMEQAWDALKASGKKAADKYKDTRPT
jgi:hypothetical protein